MPSLFVNPRAVTSTTPSCVPFAIKKPYNAYRESNRLLPIFRIYPDLLEYIFILGVNLEKTIQQRQSAVLSYSQTCHDWRTLALSIKSLWGGLVDFEENSEVWNEELLQRSYPSPIVVGSTAYALRHSHVISAELAHLERIRIYRVGFQASAWDILLERLQQPAPHIEYLNLNHVDYDAINSPTLPSTLFAGDAPHLKRLEMTHCLVNFQAPVLRSLTTLSVENLSPLIAPTPLEWLEHLGRMPLLTSLRLANSMSSQGPSSERINHDQVKLSHLSVLMLDTTLQNTHTFVHGLKFPVNCGMVVSCSECYPGPELDIVLLAYLSRLDYAHHLRPDYCPFFIHARKSRVSIWNVSSDDSNTASPPALCLNLDLGSLKFWESLLTPVLYRLQEAFSNFTSLELQLPATHPGLLGCLVRATRLTQLTNLSATMTKNLLSQMQIIQPSGFIALPALDTIVFTDDESMWGAPYRAFVSFLTWRRSAGYPITRISFRQCLVLDDTALSLGLLGVQVDCDSEGLRWQRL